MRSVLSTPILLVCQLSLMLAAGGACSSANVSASGAGGCAGTAYGGTVDGGNLGGKDGEASAGTGGLFLNIPDAGPVDACVAATAATACKSYCGLIGDGCDGKIDCGNNCPATWTCDTTSHTCVGGPDCKPPFQCTYTAGSTSGSYCGNISDGCGHKLPCGDNCAGLSNGWVCENNLCVGSAAVCAPTTCDPVAGAR